MQSRLSITRKTYYALGVVAMALTMAQAILVVFGSNLMLLDNVAFVLTGLMFLFLAAVKGSDPREKTRYFLCFLLLLCGGGVLLVLPGVNRVAAALVWPVFLWYEELRQGGLRRQAMAVSGAEAVSLILWLLVVPGGVGGLRLAANLVWLAVTVVRAWAIMTLYKKESARLSGQESCKEGTSR